MTGENDSVLFTSNNLQEITSEIFFNCKEMINILDLNRTLYSKYIYQIMASINMFCSVSI